MMLQPGAAAAFLNNPLLRDQGLLSRCLVAAPLSLAGTRTYREPDPADDLKIQAYSDNILHLLRKTWPLAAGTRNELQPRALQLNPAAAAIWRAFYDRVEGQSGKSGELHIVRDFAAKAAEHAARLAGVLTVVRDVGADEIGTTEMEGAVEVVNWYLAEAVRLAAASFTNPKIAAAQRLLDWLLERRDETISVRTICQYGPAGLRNKAAADAALKILEDHGWVKLHTLSPQTFSVWRDQ